MKKKQFIDSLRKLSADITSIADALDEDTGQELPEPEHAEDAPPENPPEEKTVSYEEAREILSRVSHAGHREEVKALVMSHGGKSVSSYKDKPDILAALVKEAEGLADGK